jgi:beta-glucanase (GH16 family)
MFIIQYAWKAPVLVAAVLLFSAEARSQTFDPNNPLASGYTRVFFDDFTLGYLDTTKWYPGWPWGSGLNNTYPNDEALPSDVTFSNGVVQFAVKRQRSPSKKRYSTAAATTYGKFSQTYGYWEASVRMPNHAHGLWPAFWLVAADGSWPPEIDIFEWLGNSPNTIYMALHYGANNSQEQTIYTGSDYSAGYHKIGVLWTPTTVTWFIDGVQRGMATSGVPTKPMAIILNNDTGGWNGNAVDRTTVFPALLAVDYVAVWKPPRP